MAVLRLPISLILSSNSPARRRVNSLHPLLHKSLIFPPNSLPKPIPTRIFPITCHSKTTEHHHHHHHHNCGEIELTKPQLAFAEFAKAVKWTGLADLLREHLEICCFSAVLLLAATACPYLVPKASVKLVQHVLALVAFPLVGQQLMMQRISRNSLLSAISDNQLEIAAESLVATWSSQNYSRSGN
ncbi:hypothetical protein L1987_66117 [Smallanthus sonchifolius]|uniref:Uncharacterized protein n=1 Tax=Smallanthus sonchifolius TaxID=185202 RepID=A0ACB9BWE2_9ASTR|nr:hypothetical protein L1987_66117 [Smallanthus sonchifolius]